MRLKVTFIVLSLGILIVSGTVFMLTSRCRVPHPVLCELIQSEDTHLSGIWEEDTSDRVIHFTLQGSKQEIRHEVAGRDEFYLIDDGEHIYVKDLEAGRWKKQERAVHEQFQTKLPFEPAVFFANLKDDLQAQQTTIVSEGKESCEGQECSVFRMVRDSMEYRLYVTRDRLFSLEILAPSQVSISLAGSQETVIIPDIGVQDAVRGENIVLEGLTTSVQQRTIPTFVQEFQESRIEAEQQGRGDRLPLYVTPTSSPTPTP